MTERFFPFERRSHTRFTVPAARVEIVPVGAQTIPSPQATLVDLSIGGLSFACAAPIELGASFRFTLYLPDHEPMHLLGKVKWRGRGPKTAGYVYGVEFARYGTAPGENPLEYEKALLALESSILEPKAE
ncbi:MAG: PilZ domain-containing protein [Planctomycetota bacterium]